jgi:hypothetical protein
MNNIFQLLQTIQENKDVDDYALMELELMIRDAINDSLKTGNKKPLIIGLGKHLSMLLSSTLPQKLTIALFIINLLSNLGILVELDNSVTGWVNGLLSRCERGFIADCLIALITLLLNFKGVDSVQKQVNATWAPKAFSIINKYLSTESNELVTLFNAGTRIIHGHYWNVTSVSQHF